jgi:hypothetical protein
MKRVASVSLLACLLGSCALDFDAPFADSTADASADTAAPTDASQDTKPPGDASAGGSAGQAGSGGGGAGTAGTGAAGMGGTAGTGGGGPQYRRAITLTSGVSPIPAGVMIPVVFDHGPLVAASKALASGNDVRIRRLEGTDWVELDRVADFSSAWGSPLVLVFFATRDPIPHSQTDTSYYLYYGDPAATAAPADPNKVCALWEDFESGDLSRWTDHINAPYFNVTQSQVHSGSYALQMGADSTAHRILTANGVTGTNLALTAWWRFSQVATLDVAQLVRASYTGTIDSYDTNYDDTKNGWSIGRLVNSTWKTLATSGNTNAANTWTRITTQIMGTQMRGLRDGANVVPVNGWVDVGTQLASGGIGFRAWNLPAGAFAWVDDICMSPYAYPEPTVSLGNEQQAPFSGN